MARDEKQPLAASLLASRITVTIATVLRGCIAKRNTAKRFFYFVMHTHRLPIAQESSKPFLRSTTSIARELGNASVCVTTCAKTDQTERTRQWKSRAHRTRRCRPVQRQNRSERITRVRSGRTHSASTSSFVHSASCGARWARDFN